MLSPENSLWESVALVLGMLVSDVGHECFYSVGREEHWFLAWFSGLNARKLESRALYLVIH